MSVVAFIIAVLALIVGYFAFKKTGGVSALRKDTAEALARLEKRLREGEKPGAKAG
jgi:hypothetical protein